MPELAGLDQDAGIALLDRAAGIGLLEPARRRVLPDPSGAALVLHHPVHNQLRSARRTQPPAAPSAPTPRPSARSATTYWGRLKRATKPRSFPCWEPRRPTCATRSTSPEPTGSGSAATGCLQGLRILYERTGRDGEWARLVASITPDFTDPDTGGPLPGREDYWSIVTGYRVKLARKMRGTGPPPPPSKTPPLRGTGTGPPRRWPPPPPASPSTSAPRSAASAPLLASLGNVLLAAGRSRLPFALPGRHSPWISGSATARPKPSALAASATPTCVPGLRDLDQAEHWLPAQPQPAPQQRPTRPRRLPQSTRSGRPGTVPRRPRRR